MLKRTARKYPLFKARFKVKNLAVQINVMGDPAGRYFTTVRVKSVQKERCILILIFYMIFGSAGLAVKLPTSLKDSLSQTNSQFLQIILNALGG